MLLQEARTRQEDLLRQEELLRQEALQRQEELATKAANTETNTEQLHASDRINTGDITTDNQTIIEEKSEDTALEITSDIMLTDELKRNPMYQVLA
jgi:hypothetical protein